MGLGDINIRYTMPNCEKRIIALEKEVHNLIYHSTTGTSGTSGSNGTSGTSGASGQSGTSGINGTTGTSGTSGTSPFVTDTNFANTDLTATGNRIHNFETNSLTILGQTVDNGTFSYRFNNSGNPYFEITGDTGSLGGPQIILRDLATPSLPFRIESGNGGCLFYSQSGTNRGQLTIGPGGVAIFYNDTGSGNTKEISTVDTGITVTDTIDLEGMHYFADYSVNGISTYGDRWIPDVGYLNSKILTSTAILDFDLTAVDSQDLTMTVTGATVGDAVCLGLDPSSVPADITYFGWVSSSDTITIRCSRVGGAGPINPTSGTFRATVLKP